MSGTLYTFITLSPHGAWRASNKTLKEPDEKKGKKKEKDKRRRGTRKDPLTRSDRLENNSCGSRFTGFGYFEYSVQ